ncbi:MAG: DUF4209 domain-containing protein [Armatimonadota bacterium]
MTIDGQRLVGAQSGETANIELEIMRTFCWTFRWGALAAGWGISWLTDEQDMGLQDMMGEITESDVIEPWRLKVLERAMSAYLEGDYLSFLHLVVPQIEGILAQILRLSGEPTTQQLTHGSSETRQRPLVDMLQDDTMRKILGEDVIYAFRAVLTKRNGLNLRNEIAHGLADWGAFNWVNANMVLLLLFQLVCLRRTDNTSQ